MGDTETETRKRSAEVEPADTASIFDVEGGAQGVNYIVIYRYEPAIDEGMIRKASPDLTEWEIQQKHGGGVYELTGRTATGRIVRGAKKKITIAGDPILSSATKQEQWSRANSVEVRSTVATSSPSPVAPAGPTFGEMITLITSITQTAQAAAAATHAQQMEMIRAEQARREREQQERDDRLRREAREDGERREKQLEESRDRDRAHQKVMLDLVKSGQPAPGDGGTTLQTFIAGMTTALKFAGGGRDDDDDQGGGEPVDPITAAIQTLPEVVAQIMGGGKKEEPAAVASAPASAAQTADPDSITLQGTTARGAAAFVEHFKRQGKDPAALLERAMETMIRSSKKPAPAAPAPVAPDAVIPPAKTA
jgi:hypothetical protein